MCVRSIYIYKHIINAAWYLDIFNSSYSQVFTRLRCMEHNAATKLITSSFFPKFPLETSLGGKLP